MSRYGGRYGAAKPAEGFQGNPLPPSGGAGGLHKVVYTGKGHKSTGYRVWRGGRGSNGASFTSSEVYSTLSRAIKAARVWERKGFDTQITEEGS